MAPVHHGFDLQVNCLFYLYLYHINHALGDVSCMEWANEGFFAGV
ncbi:MAG: hypothetical protein A4E36_01686 [Methanoregulaceae archaeon PtaB.Bin009]|jgi:hypothetical protein|nr:MAG: hypothetical protein A4E36_01686 [Methanoregulaceae archaeon PtaB.Bin009]OPY38525.1 MAG: hypothetical protein A4E41_01938 [Methanoregulaceae archaeon PtaU1.Bin066]